MTRRRNAVRAALLLFLFAGDILAEEPEETKQPEPSDSIRWTIGFQGTYTWLPSYDGDGLALHEIEAAGTLSIPFCHDVAPLRITPSFAVRLFDGPNSSAFPGSPDLPPQVYDAALDIGWRPRLAEWLFADIGITPGLYSDFTDINQDSFRLRGRALGIVALSREFQIVAGLLYVNRLDTKLLPAGGILWKPDEATRLDLVFPQPKVSRRLGITRYGEWWGYVAGEFGGGTWTLERANGRQDTVDYRDVRVLLGLECASEGGPKWRGEIGYVFNRNVDYVSTTPEFEPSNTILLRVGVSY